MIIRKYDQTTNRHEIIPSTQSLSVNISLTTPMHILSDNKTGTASHIHFYFFFGIVDNSPILNSALVRIHLRALYFPFYIVSNIKSHYSFSSYGNGVESSISSIFYLVNLILFFPEERH